MTGTLLVDLTEAAQRLSVSRRLVQSLVYAGTLRSVRVGRRRLVAAVDLETFVAQLREDAGNPHLTVVPRRVRAR